METKDLENRTTNLSERYLPVPRRIDNEIKIPLKSLQYAMLISGAGTIIAGAALAYSLFPDTIDSIIKYFSQSPF